MLFEIQILEFLVFALVLGGDHNQHTDWTVIFEHKVSKLNMSSWTNEHNITGTDTYMYAWYYMLIWCLFVRVLHTNLPQIQY